MVYGTNSPGYERSRVRIVQGTNSLETQTYLPTKWHLDPSSRLVTAYMGQKLGVVPLGVAGSSSNKCGQSRGLPPYQVACWSIQPFDLNIHWPKSGGRCAPFWESVMWSWPRPIPRTKWHVHPSSRLATIHGPKGGGSVPPFRGAGFPCNTVLPGPRLTSVPSGILIYPAVWLQHMGRKLGELSTHLTQCGRGLPLCPVSIQIHPQYTNITNSTGQDRQTGQTTVR